MEEIFSSAESQQDSPRCRVKERIYSCVRQKLGRYFPRPDIVDDKYIHSLFACIYFHLGDASNIKIVSTSAWF